MTWSEIPWRPTDRVLRQFAATSVVVGGFVAWRIGFPDTIASGLVAIIAGLIGIAGWRTPQSLRLPFVALSVAIFPIGWLVSRILLAGMFFGIFTPVGLFFRLIGRDALALRPEPGRLSYWEPRPEEAGVERYFKQY
jgi:hypothetical protein